VGFILYFYLQYTVINVISLLFVIRYVMMHYYQHLFGYLFMSVTLTS
jgi:hypothetical protein